MWVLHHVFFVFRVGMLFRNFDLEWIRFPEFPDLGFLHGRLKAFGVQSILREGIVKLHFCCWLDLFFTRPKLAFLWWYLSRCSCPEAPECFRVLPPVVTRAAGWQGLRQRRWKRDHCGCLCLVSYSLCQVYYCLRILRNNKTYLLLYFFSTFHFAFETVSICFSEGFHLLWAIEATFSIELKMMMSGEAGHSCRFHSYRLILWCFGRNWPLVRWMLPTCPALSVRNSRLWGNLPICPELSTGELTGQSEMSCDPRMSESFACSKESSSCCSLWLIPSLCGHLTSSLSSLQEQELQEQGSTWQVCSSIHVMNEGPSSLHLLFPWEQSPK